MSSKKNALSLANIMYALAIILGVVAICLMFAPAMKVTGTYTGFADASYKGTQTAFGYATENVTYLAFSFMNMLTYILVVVAVVLSVLRLCGVLKSKVVDYVVIALFVVAGIFFFCTVSFSVLGEDYASLIDTANKIKEGTITKSLGVGAIVSGILSLVSAVAVVLKLALNKK